MNRVALETINDHFKNLNNVNNDREGVFNFDMRNSDINENSELNRSFSSEDDILMAIKSLKNNKAVVMI